MVHTANQGHKCPAVEKPLLQEIERQKQVHRQIVDELQHHATNNEGPKGISVTKNGRADPPLESVRRPASVNRL